MVGLSVEVPLDAAFNWLEGIRQRKHGREVDSAATVIYHGGVIVVYLRAVKDLCNRILRPLAHFNPADWPPDRRQDCIAELWDLQGDLPAFDEINIHVAALMSLTARPDPEVGRLRHQLVSLASNVTSLGRDLTVPSQEPRWANQVARYRRIGEQEEGYSTATGGADALIRDYLPALVWLVRTASGRERDEIESLRVIAKGLAVTRSHGGDQELATVVTDAVTTFGRLRGILEQQFPEVGGSAKWADMR